MLLDSSLEEGLDSFYHLYMDAPEQPSQSSPSLRHQPSSTSSSQRSKTENHGILITAPPELRLRNPVPEPQNVADCSQADQSASQAIQQASQQASQSIQQASQSASQASQQAAQSASNAIQQFSNQASQSIAAASRSVSAAMQSASAAVASASSQIASAQSSAASAISRANGSMMNAQASATMAQSQASAALLQAGAAVAAATGSAAAAGSSFLAAAAKATQSAQASVSAIGAQASQQVSQASQQTTASQNAAVTATQAALAIVGSIIASALITILIFLLVARHKKSAKRKRGDPSLGNVYFSDPKMPIAELRATTAVPSQAAYNGNRDLDPMSGSQSTFALFPRATDEKPTMGESKKNEELRRSIVKSTTVPWNPHKPPKAPTLGSWLKLQDGVSPFGPIKLPLDDEKSASPLGGQLKSPMTTKPTTTPRSPRMSSGIGIPTRSPGLGLNRSPKLPVVMSETPVATKVSSITAVPKSPLTLPVEATSPRRPDMLPQHSIPGPQYRESKASVWTDDLPDPSPSPPLQSPPPELKNKGPAERRPINSMQKVSNMEIPAPVNPIRNTAEWFAERARLESTQRDSRASQSQYQSQYGKQSSAYVENRTNNRPSFGLPRGIKIGGGAMGLPARPGPSRQIRSVEAEVGYVQGLNRFLGPDGRPVDYGDRQRGSMLSRMGSDRSANASTPGGRRSALNTPGVGKAL